MDMGTYVTYVWVGVVIFLMFKLMYHDKRLKRYIDRQYPEESKVIRLYEWQWYPWSVGRRTMWALVNKQRTKDPELACLAKKAKFSIIYCIAWLIVIISTQFFIYF